MEDRNKHKADEVAHVQRHDHVGSDAERLLRENSQVEKQNGNLGQRQDAEVDRLIEEVDLLVAAQFSILVKSTRQGID